MLVDGKPITDVHLNLLLKIVRGCQADEFANCFEQQQFPKVKMGPAEQKIKEKFWQDIEQGCNSRGLLNPAVATKVAA
ncbi:MAG: hypothetical protein COT73_09630 [Bdellovibrio sp. CG10_big_fil_rev_8_21_14_0_10_47_8]|nr:MAG: hypothetical protein COT73_09630 [Bdellovibrio sp. CG10_big_fil_rev_8_21_14_0_10_47_8]